MKNKFLLVCLLLPFISSAQLSKSSFGLSLGLMQHFNKTTPYQANRASSNNGTTGMQAAFEWQIPITNHWSFIPNASYGNQTTKYIQNDVYETFGVSARTMEKYHLNILSAGLDVNYETKNGLGFRTGWQHAQFTNHAYSSSTSASSYGGGNISIQLPENQQNFGFKTSMFRAKLGTYKTLSILGNPNFNVGIDILLPFKKLPNIVYDRTVVINGNTLRQQYDYSIKFVSAVFYAKYNFLNLKPNAPKPIDKY